MPNSFAPYFSEETGTTIAIQPTEVSSVSA